MHTVDVSVDQLRAARHLLRWKQADLAAHSGVSRVTISAMERGESVPTLATMRALIHAIERGGVDFTPGGCALRDAGRTDLRRTD